MTQAKTPKTLLAAMAISSPVALNIYAPVMPELADQFSTSPFTIQLGFTLYLFTLAIGQLIGGPLADQYGRRPVLIWGFTLHILGCLLGVFATETWQLLLARVMQAAGGCTGMLLARSIILDQHGKDKAAGMLGYIALGIASAQALAPTLGGYLNVVAGWQSVFWFSMALGTLVWLGAVLKLPETDTARQATQRFFTSFARYRLVLRNPAFVWYALASTLIACGFFIFIASAPFIVSHHLQGSSVDYGNWFLVVAGGFWFGSLLAGKLSAAQGTQRMMAFGQGLAGIGAVSMLILFFLLPVSYLTLFLPFALFTFGRGLSQPNAQAAAIAATTVSSHCISGKPVSDNHDSDNTARKTDTVTPSPIATATGLQGCLQLLVGSLMAQLTPVMMQAGIVVLPLIFLCLVMLAVYCSRKGAHASHKKTV